MWEEDKKVGGRSKGGRKMRKWEEDGKVGGG